MLRLLLFGLLDLGVQRVLFIVGAGGIAFDWLLDWVAVAATEVLLLLFEVVELLLVVDDQVHGLVETFD